MSTITSLGAADAGNTSRTTINTNFTNLNTDKAEQASIQTQGYTYKLDTGAADAYVVTLAPVPAAYAAGMRITFKAANTNTGTSTLNVNSLGAKTIKKLITQDLAAGDITENAIVSMVYDGTNFQLEGISVGSVYTSGNQTIAGVKTFTTIPELPAANPTTDNQASRKVYIDGLLTALKAQVVVGSNGFTGAGQTHNLVIGFIPRVIIFSVADVIATDSGHRVCSGFAIGTGAGNQCGQEGNKCFYVGSDANYITTGAVTTWASTSVVTTYKTGSLDRAGSFAWLALG